MAEGKAVFTYNVDNPDLLNLTIPGVPEPGSEMTKMAKYFIVTGSLAVLAVIILVIYYLLSIVAQRRAIAMDRKSRGLLHVPSSGGLWSSTPGTSEGGSGKTRAAIPLIMKTNRS